jgi:hypothetical protein
MRRVVKGSATSSAVALACRPRSLIPKGRRSQQYWTRLSSHTASYLFPERDVCFAPFEARDYDFVLRFGPADQPIYCPVQLKVLVSVDVSTELTPEILLSGLGKYADASNLVVAVKIDRPGIDPRKFKIPQLRVGELWFFGQHSATTDGWSLYGDCLGTPQWFEFELS